MTIEECFEEIANVIDSLTMECRQLTKDEVVYISTLINFEARKFREIEVEEG